MLEASSTKPALGPANNISHGKAVAILLIGTACLAFTAIWVKGANFEPATSVVLRCWLPIVIFLPYAIREYKKKGSLNKAGFFWSAVAGLILGIDFTAWNYSIFFVGAGIASVLLNLQVFGMTPQAAVEAPRFATFSFPDSFEPHATLPGRLTLEARIEDDVARDLGSRGHDVRWWPEWAWQAGGVCLVVADAARRTYCGAADPRRHSYAVGW